MKEAKKEFEKKKKLFEERKLSKFLKTLPSKKGILLRMNPYNEQNYILHTQEIRKDHENFKSKIELFTKAMIATKLLLENPEKNGSSNIAEYLTRNEILIDAMVEIFANCIDKNEHEKLCKFMYKYESAVILDKSGGISSNTYGLVNMEPTTVSRKEFIFLCLSKFQLTFDIKDIIDEICLMAMDLKVFEDKSYDRNQTETEYRGKLWGEFYNTGKKFLSLLESKL